MPNNNNKRVKYTRGHIEYILKNYRAYPEKCVRETGPHFMTIVIIICVSCSYNKLKYAE
jgi:hypothetical protein